MYIDKSLNLSTSVPIFSGLQQRTNQNYLRYSNNTQQSNSYKQNNGKVGDNSFQAKKVDSQVNFTSSQKFNQSHESQKYGVAQSQIQNEPNQAYRFQFKRSSMNSSRPNISQSGQTNSQTQEMASSNIYTQNVPNSVSQVNVNNKSLQKETSELEKKIKDLQNQLKFQEKYANDLYKTSEEAKKEAATIKQEKIKLQEQITRLSKSNDQLTQNLNEIRKLYDQQMHTNYQLKTIIYENNEKILIFQNNQMTNVKQINALKEKINNFNSYYRNELYQERIRQLNEELITANSLLTQSILEKTKLNEEIKAKNDKILSLSISSPTKNKQSITKSINLSQKANEAINNAFEQSLRLSQAEIHNLKQTIQQRNEDNRKLRQEIIQYKKEIQALKQDGKVTILKYNAQKNQLTQEKESRLNEKSNEIKTLSNRLNMIEQRYNKALREIKEKDLFLQEHLVGRAKDLQLKEYIEKIMQNYVNTFESRVTLEQKVKLLQKQLEAIKNQ